MLAALVAASSLPTAFHAVLVAPRIRAWGATRSELLRSWPGDDLVPEPGVVWTNAVTIERPPSEVWPWVTQLGQGRAGLYSYDWLENALLADVHSLSEVVPELQRHLTVGERVVRMTRYAPFNPVAAYEPGHALILGGTADTPAQLRAGRPGSTWAFIVEPADGNTSRLVIRSRSRGLVARAQGPIQFVMQRRMMQGIKRRAEGTWAPGPADILVPLSWFAAAAVTVVHASHLLTERSATRDALSTGLAATGVQVLLFWDVPPGPRAALTTMLVASTVTSRRGRRRDPPAGRTLTGA